eukprot:CAMPEP_0184329810 /NCGR_PEP_ID=MMETSP1049-20130417/144346_1 /TAXON_ID=77928 /ORGANISM="Proteomonas sulcata, Strain CCMP704" /LENGTH=116 /DNA_ID=CAMNT_0026652199 /DNA_START=308 /DNA_END=658 /DNA_ORIENTATION=-
MIDFGQFKRLSTRITAEDLEVVLQQAGPSAHLEGIDLSGSTAVNDDILIQIAESFKGLKYLGLNRVEGITDRGIKQIVKGIKALKMLEVEEASLSPNIRTMIDFGQFKRLLVLDVE